MSRSRATVTSSMLTAGLTSWTRSAYPPTPVVNKCWRTLPICPPPSTTCLTASRNTRSGTTASCVTHLLSTCRRSTW
ncbi:hypothetical protein RRG08_000873 [Elysia crispata]|uniref:Uncharacterized protein n=1 Tax=Elysia crispata TaxID=231223 RepID=A0AAE1DGE1_9GAST|nr:hypothetical protein RRG08_000873 [Elysia crispata]